MNNDFFSIVEDIDPQKAVEYLKFNKVNRPLNQTTVNMYAEDMKKGQWKLNGEAICFLKGGALGNGQHRLNAVIKSGVSIKFLVAYNCDEDSLASYDSGRNRKPSDVFALNQIPNYTNVSSAVIRYFLLVNEVNAFSVGGSLSSLRRDKKVSRQDLLNEYFSTPDLYQHAHNFSASCYRKYRIMTNAEIAGMYVFLVKWKKHNVENVEGFFNALFFGKGRQMRVIELLRERLFSSKMSNKTISSKYKGALITKAWNAFISNKDTKCLKWNEETEGRVFMI